MQGHVQACATWHSRCKHGQQGATHVCCKVRRACQQGRQLLCASTPGVCKMAQQPHAASSCKTGCRALTVNRFQHSSKIVHTFDACMQSACQTTSAAVAAMRLQAMQCNQRTYHFTATSGADTLRFRQWSPRQAKVQCARFQP
jgi:hypothetical protein